MSSVFAWRRLEALGANHSSHAWGNSSCQILRLLKIYARLVNSKASLQVLMSLAEDM